METEQLPVNEWICDTCAECVDVAGGAVAWKEQGGKVVEYRIYHNKHECDPKSQGFRAWHHMKEFVGVNGVAYMTALLSNGPIMGGGPTPVDQDAWVDVFRRIHIPYYEEARLHFSDDDVREYFSDSNEVYPYTQRGLKRIAEGIEPV